MMGSSQSCEACDLEKNGSTKSRSYVEELLHIKHANFLNTHSIESKEVLQLRRERILKALSDRKPVKPYAVQLLEARAAANGELSISEKPQELMINSDAQSSNLMGQKNTREPDQKSRILQRIAARRKSKRSLNNSPTVSASSVTTVNSLPSNDNTSEVKSSELPAVNISPSSSIFTLTPTASNKATQSDPPVQVPVLSTASQSSSVGSFVDSAIQVAPVVQSSPQQTVRLSEPKIYVQPPNPPTPKILTPPPVRLWKQTTLSARQSISAAFSRPSPSAVESCLAPTLPSFIDLLENVCKENLNQSDNTKSTECILCVQPPVLSENEVCNGTGKQNTNFNSTNYNKLSNWKPVLMEMKRRNYDKEPVPLTSSPIKSLSSKKLSTLDKEQSLEFNSDDSCRKRHTAVVDRLTDSLMANWAMKKTSAELLGADEKELSLLTYGEWKRPVVPHFPVRREKDQVKQGNSNHDGSLVLTDSLPSVRFGKSRHSQLHCEPRREKRCMRHRHNKI